MGLLIGDDLWAVVIFTAIFLLLVDLVHRRKFWTAHYPPGPVPLPGLGNLLQVDFENMPYSLYKLRNRYGDVFSLQMAWKPMVVINGLKAVRELLVTYGEDTADRPLLPIYNHLGYGHKSKGVILAPYGPEWREQRRFSVSTLRDFGLGKKSLEQWVTEEAGHLCDAFTKETKHPFNPSMLLSKAVSNVIASLVYARRFEYEDRFFNRMLKTLKESFGEDTGFIAEVCGSEHWAWPLLCYKSYQSKYEFREVGSGPGVIVKCREKGLDIDKPLITGGKEQIKVNVSKGVSFCHLSAEKPHKSVIFEG